MKKKCIIYGGGGFIGSHLAESLLEKEYDVTVFDKINFSKKNLSGFINDIEVIEGDFNNEKNLLSSLKGKDYVYHLVSSTLPASSNENPVYDAETNLLSSLKLLGDLSKNKVKKIIFLSSGGTVYGIPERIPIKEVDIARPVCSYGIIKKTIEDYLYLFNYLYGTSYTVFRLANPYGERQNPLYAQGAIPVFILKALKNETINIWGDGSIKRDYIYIKDAIEPLVKALSFDGTHRVYNLGSGKSVSLNELIQITEKELNKKIKIKYMPGRKFDVPENLLDISRLKKEFGFIKRTNLEIGIRKTINYIKENY